MKDAKNADGGGDEPRVEKNAEREGGGGRVKRVKGYAESAGAIKEWNHSR